MIRKSILPLLAVLAFVFALRQVLLAQKPAALVPPPVLPAVTPFSNTVAGAGIVEAQTENISVGSPVPGIVSVVHVTVGQSVQAKDVLFELDSRTLNAELKFRQANLAAAKAELLKLKQFPRPEEIPASEARVKEAEANVTEKQDRVQRMKQLAESRTVTAEMQVQAEQALQMALSQLAKANADHQLLLAGTWQPDIALAEAAVEQAAAQLEMTNTELERLKIRARMAGRILQVNVRPGEFAGAQPGQSLVQMGSTDVLHVRVDIDEHDIPRFHEGAPARATLRGDPGHAFPLTFLHVEPYVVPKRSLTGDNTERVDTRVLQVIYALGEGHPKIFVGQQLDVFVEVPEGEVPELETTALPQGSEGASSEGASGSPAPVHER